MSGALTQSLRLGAPLVTLSLVFLFPLISHSQGVGVYQRPACTSLTSPVVGSTVCFDTTSNSWKSWDGTTWRSDLANGTALVNVKDYGAKGDGVADDTAAFTSAGSAATTLEVHLPPGTYKLNSNPTPTGSVTWVLHSGATTTGAGVLPGKIVKFGATESALSILNRKTIATVNGEAPGIKVGIADGSESQWTTNPAAGDFGVLYSYISSSAVRNRIWAINPIADIISGSPATAWAIEANINVGTANAPDPHATNHALGIDIVSGGAFAPSAGLSIYGTSAANRWKHGIWLDYIGGQAGSTLIAVGKATVGTSVSVDFGLDLSLATINYQGVRVGATPVGQVAPVAVRQFANNQVGLFLQRFTDTAPTGNLFQVTNAANNAVLAQIDALGNYTSSGANVTANNFVALGAAGIVSSGQIAYGSTVASTVGAAGAAAALPANPLGYIVVNVGGTQAKIPYYNN